MVRFNHPEMFYLFILFALFILWNYFKDRKQQTRMKDLAKTKIRKFLFNRVIFSRIKLRSNLWLLATIFFILASTGPQVGTKLAELKRTGIDIFIVFDTSTSMDAVDVSPSRLEKAKYELSRLINGLQGDRVGLIVFSGSAHLHCPLTSDYAAARLFLNTIDTDIVQSKGTDLASALELTLENIEEESQKYKLIVLVTDGEDHIGKALELAQKAKKRNIVIHTLGVGTPAGGPIPILDDTGSQTFKKDQNGNVITTALNDAILSEISIITGGEFLRVENQSNAIGPLLDEIDKMEKRELKSHVFTQYEDRFQVLLMIAILCLLIEFFVPTRSKKEIVWEGRFTQ